MPQPEAALRKNGREQACEPCRKSKMRCDHTRPFCRRCSRRKMTSDCVYHPAPMTRPKFLSPVPSVEDHSSTCSPAQGSSHRRPELNAIALETNQPLVEDGTSRSPVFKTVGASGVDSFSAIFTENETNFGLNILDVGMDDKQLNEGVNSLFASRLQKGTDSVAQARMRQGIEALRCFPSRYVCERLLETFPAIKEVTLSPRMIRTAMSSVFSIYGDHINSPRSSEGLSHIVLDLYKNVDRSLSCDHPDLWMTWFAVPYLTWEMMGILFTFFGAAFMTLSEEDQLFSRSKRTKYNRRTAALEMKDCADICLKVCDDTDTVNELVIVLTLNLGHLEGWCVGDESHRASRRYGDANSVVIATGLHRLTNTGDVTIVSEYRKAWFSSAYTMDKTNSSFNGRPPGLTRHYCKWSIPLDLNEEELLGGPERLAVAVSRLDANGWNTEGVLKDRTIYRALMMQTPIREETLEMSLGIDAQFSQAHIDDLIVRLDSIVASYPPQLHYTIQRASQLQGFELYGIIRINLEYLQNRYLIERVKLSRTYGSGQELLDVAIAMMKTVLSLWLRRDKLQNFISYFDWLGVSCGIPAAGVLCVELLKQSRTPQESTLRFSRSKLIRDLTIFIAFLDWIRPTDGNYLLCGKVSKVVQKIVDDVLETPLRHPSSPALQPEQPQQLRNYHLQTAGMTETSMIGSSFRVGTSQHQFDPLWMVSDDTDECLDWLNNQDWMQGPWLDSNQ